MSWIITYKPSAKKQLRKLDPQISERIVKFLSERVLERNHPRALGKTLAGEFAGSWAYRVGHYRVLCDILEDRLIIHVIDIEHRREVYK